MLKRIKRTLAILLTAGLCANSMAVRAAGNVEMPDKGGGLLGVNKNINDGLIIDFNMESMNNGAIINTADNRAFTVLGTSPTLVDSKDGHNKALQFDGSTNYVDLGMDYQIPDNQTTIAAWVKVDPNPNGLSRITCRSRTGVSGEKDLSIEVRNNGRLEANTAGWCSSNEGAVLLGEWQHVAVSFDGVQQTLYVNGEIVKREAFGEQIEDDWQTANLLVGAGWNNAGDAPFADHMFKGLMDDLKIYTRALSQDEIKILADDKEQEDDGNNQEDDGNNQDDNISLPDAIYDFTMDEVRDGTGDLMGKKVIINNVDGNEYPIYGNYRVDDFGIYNNSIEFDGSTAYVNIGKPDIHTQYTFSAWTNINSATQGENRLNKIFGRDRTTITDADSMYFTVRGTGNIEFQATEVADKKGNWLPSGEGVEHKLQLVCFDFFKVSWNRF